MKRSPKKIQALVEAIETGLSIESACKLVGIHRSTFYEWRERPEISSQIDRALAVAEAALLGSIREAGRGDWRASAWILERRYPESWSRRDTSRVEATGHLALILRNLDQLSDSQLMRISAGEDPREVVSLNRA